MMDRISCGLKSSPAALEGGEEEAAAGDTRSRGHHALGGEGIGVARRKLTGNISITCAKSN